MILLRLESSPTGRAPRDLEITAFTADEIGYHAHIMKQEGLIEGTDIGTMHSTGREVKPTSLTWKGHEFLELARDQDRWNQAKAIIAKLRGAPISVWTKVLTDLMLEKVDGVGSQST